jgi:hypothetical protein
MATPVWCSARASARVLARPAQVRGPLLWGQCLGHGQRHAGGWEGPYITNELWCALNAYVIAKYAANSQRTEEEIFSEFATQQLGLKGGDVARFRELNLLSAAAVLRGQCSLKGPVDL